MRPYELPRIAQDPAAFEAFYREHVEAVLRFVTRRVDDPHLAADLTADVFLAAVDAAPSFRPDCGVAGAWLYGIARNTVSAQRRRAAREHRAHAELQGRRLLEDDDIARLQERIDAQARAAELHAALSDLSKNDREVLDLVALDGLSAAEAAAVLGIRAVTARVRMHRARRALRRQLFDDDTPALIQPMEV